MTLRFSRRLPLRPWGEALWVHVPGGREVDLDALAESGGRNDRWNDPGRPTAYLASDPGVAVAEYGRHRDPAAGIDPRQLLRLEVELRGLLDLRDPTVLDELGIRDAPAAFLDRARARAIARRVRDRQGVTGLIVPSMAFLDRLERCNVVLFADAVDGGVAGVVADWTLAGHLEA